MGFRLGNHGQGYEISSVGIDLAAVPSSLNVSLWISDHPGHTEGAAGAQRKLFDFTNPSAFRVGLNQFTAPAGAFAYPNIGYWIVLTGFGSSLSINETTSDGEDAGGEPGAILFNSARERTLDRTGTWIQIVESVGGEDVEVHPAPTSRSSVLRLAVEGSMREYGILASSLAQSWAGEQEIISVGDDCCFDIRVGPADCYLIRGLAVVADDSAPRGGFFGLPFDLKKGSDKLFSLAYTSAQGDLVDGPLALTSPAGISEWAAPQGATVAGGSSTTYTLKMDIKSITGDTAGTTRGGVVLSRIFGRNATAHDTQYYDTSTPGVTFAGQGAISLVIPHMAVLGEPLVPMVDNFDQTDSGYHSLGDAANKVVSQGFTTGEGTFAHRLQGIGVNIEGSDDSMSVAQIPDGPASVSVAVHADESGAPGEKLFDLISPADYAAGHSFFEAPPNTALKPNTSYVMVWSHLGGAGHRLAKTASNNEDSGKLTGSGIADAFYHGADLSSLSVSALGSALEIVVYTEAIDRLPFVEGGHPVPMNWLHIPENAEVDDQFRVVFVTHRGTYATSGNIEDYNVFVQWEAAQPYNDPIIRELAPQFKAVVCTEAVDARDNTLVEGAEHLPIRWLDGGWENRPTLIASNYDEFYGGEWVNHDWGAYVTGNSAYFYKSHFGSVAGSHMIWTGCNSTGVAHPSYPMGTTQMVVVGTPKDDNFHPLGAVAGDPGYLTSSPDRYKQIYAISPIFTVVE